LAWTELPSGCAAFDVCTCDSTGRLREASAHVTCIPRRVSMVELSSKGAAQGAGWTVWCARDAAQIRPVKTDVAAAAEEEEEGDVVEALVLTTGAEPVELAEYAGDAGCGVQIPLATALCPARLSELLCTLPFSSADGGGGGGGGGGDHHRHHHSGLVVGVVGSSHSAMVVVQHLLDARRRGQPAGALPSRNHGESEEGGLLVKRVLVFCRTAPQHAEWVDEAEDYRRTMSGLKGKGSVVARRHLERGDGSLSLPGSAAATGRRRAEVVALGLHGAEAAEAQRLLQSCDGLIQAVGFEASELPRLRIDGVDRQWSAAQLVRERDSSQLRLPRATAAAQQGDTGDRLPQLQSEW
jgi:hypothetical protein